jgi:hypothetical protein
MEIKPFYCLHMQVSRYFWTCLTGCTNITNIYVNSPSMSCSVLLHHINKIKHNYEYSCCMLSPLELKMGCPFIGQGVMWGYLRCHVCSIVVCYSSFNMKICVSRACCRIRFSPRSYFNASHVSFIFLVGLYTKTWKINLFYCLMSFHTFGWVIYQGIGYY